MKRIAVIIAAFGTAAAMTVPAFAAGTISEAKAKEIALQRAGINECSVNYMRVKQEWDGGRQEYEMEFYDGSAEYECCIDMATGDILDFDVDYD